MKINLLIDDDVESVTLNRPLPVYQFGVGCVSQMWEIVLFKDGEWQKGTEWRPSTFDAVGMAAIKAEAASSLSKVVPVGNA